MKENLGFARRLDSLRQSRRVFFKFPKPGTVINAAKHSKHLKLPTPESLWKVAAKREKLALNAFLRIVLICLGILLALFIVTNQVLAL